VNIPDSAISELLALSYHEVAARLPRNRHPTGHIPRPRLTRCPGRDLLPAPRGPGQVRLSAHNNQRAGPGSRTPRPFGNHARRDLSGASHHSALG
jgi:hypothetical protein